jgi:hypothetical protein
MGNLQSVRDELDVQRLLSDYAWACDNREWARLESLFTADAQLDYTLAAGPVGSRDDVLPWLVSGLGRVEWIQHAIMNFQTDLDGDHARSRALFHVCLRFPGAAAMLTAGGYYLTEHVRTPDGWRISWLCEDNRWMEGSGLD